LRACRVLQVERLNTDEAAENVKNCQRKTLGKTQETRDYALVVSIGSNVSIGNELNGSSGSNINFVDDILQECLLDGGKKE
jgi:hypothetical protein